MTESDGMIKQIAAEQFPAEDDNARASVVSFSEDVNTLELFPFGSSVVSTTRTVVVNPEEQLEAHRDSTSSNLIPGVKDVTKGMYDVARNAKTYIRIFRIGDNESLEVSQEQLDRVRMSKCKWKV
jgi:hypothetical protein